MSVYEIFLIAFLKTKVVTWWECWFLCRGDNSDTAGHHQQQSVFNQFTSTSPRKEVNSRKKAFCWWPRAPTPIHPPFYLQHLLSKKWSLKSHLSSKGLHESLCTGRQTWTAAALATCSNKFQETTFYFRSDQKPHYLNQDIWFKCSAFFLYVYPLGHSLLVYTTC